MKVLFLDDDPTRHAKFRQAHIGVDVNYVWTAKEAIEAMAEEYFEQMSLDHDLAAQLNMELPPEGEGSGYDVALHIAQLPEDKRPKLVVIHSFNPEGARRMHIAINKAGISCIKLPFNY